MVRRRPEAPSSYSSTPTDSIGGLSYGTGSRRGFRRRRFAFFFFRRLECKIEDEESLSLDEISPPLYARETVSDQAVKKREPLLDRHLVFALASLRGIIA
ncbi:hypothetical protein PC128_g22548 [Phytophthora cactorum]|nr:hypothetical protein PC128_g22548 [Phytophthora cactorum]